MVARKFTNKQAIDALLKNYGNVSAAARALKVDHSTLFNRLQKNKTLQAARIEAEEQTLDLAENILVKLIKKNNFAAVRFLLKTKGKRRGYVEQGGFDMGLEPVTDGVCYVRNDFSKADES